MGRCSLDLCRTQKESLRQRKSQQNTFFKRQSTSETKMHILSFGQEPYRCLHCLLMELEGIWLVLLKPPKQFKTFHSNLYFQKSWLSHSNIIHRPLMSSFLLKIFSFYQTTPANRITAQKEAYIYLWTTVQPRRTPLIFTLSLAWTFRPRRKKTVSEWNFTHYNYGLCWGTGSLFLKTGTATLSNTSKVPSNFIIFERRQLTPKQATNGNKENKYFTFWGELSL